MTSTKKPSSKRLKQYEDIQELVRVARVYEIEYYYTIH